MSTSAFLTRAFTVVTGTRTLTACATDLIDTSAEKLGIVRGDTPATRLILRLIRLAKAEVSWREHRDDDGAEDVGEQKLEVV